jgi:hypothetical protein
VIETTVPPHDPEKLARWVWDALMHEPVEHVDPAGRISVPTQLQQLSFTNLDFARRLKDALAIAVIEWQPAHGLFLLASLARCAAYVRATNVVSSLYSILASGRVDGWIKSPAHKQHFSTIIGVIGGFTPLGSARTALENLFVDRRYRTRFAAQLVTGLVRADLENYPIYVEPLLEMVDDREVNLDLLAVTREIVRIATPGTIVRQLPRFHDPWHYRFCELLGGLPQSPGRWSSRHTMVLQVAPEKFAPVEYDPDDNGQANDIVAIIDRRITRAGGMPAILELLKPAGTR